MLVCPAQTMTGALMNEILATSGGLTLVALSARRTAAFVLPPMARPQTSAAVPALPSSFCVSVDAREGITTGISVEDRAETIRILGEEQPQPRKLVKPGHVFPVEVGAGGVLVRNALPEGALDLVTAAGFRDAALFIDLLDAQGELLNRDDQISLAKRMGVVRVSLTDLIRHRLNTEQLVYRYAEARLPTTHSGELRSFIYKSKLHEGEHLALVRGEIDPAQPVLTRVQTEVTAADVFGGDHPPTRLSIRRSLHAIQTHGSGVLLYLRRASPGYLQRQIREGVDAESDPQPAAIMREYGIGAQILHDLGVRKIELLTNSTKNLVGLKSFGIEIVSQRPLLPEPVPNDTQR